MSQDWNETTRDPYNARCRNERSPPVFTTTGRFDECEKDKDYRYGREFGGQSRSSSSSSKMGRRSHRDARSRSYSRSRSRSRTRTHSRSPSPSHRRSRHDRRRRSRSMTSRSRSRSRSRDRYYSEYRYSRSPRPDDEYGRYFKDRRSADAPPNATLVVKGLPPEWDDSAMWTLLGQQGFQPKDIRILKRKDTGQGRGFGFVEFVNVEEAIRWMEHTQGRLKVDDRYWADIQYSRAPLTNTATPVLAANALAAVLAQRGGDWICAKCGTNNFRKRDFCFKCNLKREESEALSGDGFSEVGAMPCDTLILRNLPAGIDEDTILSHLKNLTALDIVRIVVARDSETDEAKGYAYVQMTNSTEATQLLTSLTTLAKLVIDGQEIPVAYSKYPLTVVLTGTNLTLGTPGAASWTAACLGGGIQGLAAVSQTDVTNAAAAVAQNAIKKAHVMRHVAAQHVQQAAQLASLRAATMLVPTSTFLLQQQQILAAQALHEMATVQLLQEQVTRQAATLADLGTVKTPHGELPRYPVPETHKFQLDTTTGFYFDPSTGLHYDPNSQYFYNSETRQYLYWDSNYQTYLPAPAGEGESSYSQSESKQKETQKESTAAAVAPTAETEAKEEKADKKKEVKGKAEKVNVAKKIQKDMEKWAKQLNQRKEAQPMKPVTKFGTSLALGESTETVTTASALFDEEKTSASADMAFLILEKTGGAPGFKGGLVSYDADVDIDDDQARGPPSTQKRKSDEDEFVDWTKIACLLCRRQFPDKDVLTKHLQFSDLHKKNVIARMQQRSFDAGKTSGSGLQYRDRAKERREKFGADDEKQLGRAKDYLMSVPSAGKERHVMPDFETESIGAGTSNASNQTNIGSKLLKNMGWQEGQGLGRSNQGIVDPIMSQRRIQGAGLGASGAVVSTPASASYKEHVKAALRQKFYQDPSCD